MTGNRSWADRYFRSTDGTKLHYRDYDGPRDGPPILCLPGLTRNARDFEPVAEAFAGEWRVLAMDFRGRGESEPDPDFRKYRPETYVGDILKFLDELGIADAVFVGTSLGGICTMAIAAMEVDRIAGALLNDIGPEIEQAGLDRIANYVGKPGRLGTWSEAGAEIERRMGPIYPDYGDFEWERLARRLMREGSDGITFDYDQSIAKIFEEPAETPAADAWAIFKALNGRPVTVLRGELSDILSSNVAARMGEELEDCEVVTVPRVGHAPSFDEPESIAALGRLLGRIDRA